MKSPLKTPWRSSKWIVNETVIKKLDECARQVRYMVNKDNSKGWCFISYYVVSIGQELVSVS